MTTNDLLYLCCPGCNGRNRVPASRLNDAPRCGRCKQPLFRASPVELDNGNFSRQVEGTDIPVLVDFWAPWCGPCKAMAPAFVQAAAQLEPHFRLAKVNTEAVPALGQRFGIRSIPTLILFHHGRELARSAGALAAADIVRWARGQLPA